MKLRLNPFLRSAFFTALSLAPISTPLLYAGNTWTGGGGSTNWTDANNWGGSAPVYGTLTFTSGGTQGTTSVLNGNFTSGGNTSMNQLLWTGSSAWTLNNSGGTILSLFDNGGTQAKIENQSTGLVTINAPITFAAAAGAAWGEINAVNGNITFGSTGTITMNGTTPQELRFLGTTSRTVTVGSVINLGARKLVLGDSGAPGTNITVALNAANTYSGNTEINGGTVQVSNATALGTSTTYIGNGSTTFGNTNAALTFTTAGLTVANNILTNKADQAGSAGSGTRTIASTYGSGTTTLSGTIAINGGLVVDTTSGGTLALSGVISNGTDTGVVLRSLAKSGAGTATLSGANTYTGTTNITGGTLSIGGAVGSTISGSSSVTLTGGTALVLDYTTVGDASTDKVGDGATVTITSVGSPNSAGSSGLQLLGNATVNTSETIGTLALGGGVSVVGVTQTNSGLVTKLTATSGLTRSNFGTGLIRGSSLGGASSQVGQVVLGSLTGLVQVGTTTSATGAAGTNKDLTIVPYLIGDTQSGGLGSASSGSFLTYDTGGRGFRVIAAAEQNQLAAATDTFANTNVSYSPTVANSVLTLDATNRTWNSLQLGRSGTNVSRTLTGGGGTLAITSGALQTGDQSATDSTILNGFSKITFGNNVTGANAANEAVIFVNGSSGGNAAPLTIGSPIDVTQGGGLTKAGTGNLILAGGTNLYTGVTTLNQGTLTINSGTSIGNGGVTVNTGTTLANAGTTGTGVVTVNTGGTATNTGTIGGNVTVNPSTGAGTSNFTNSGTISGTVTINSSTVSTPVVYQGTVPVTGNVTLNGGSIVSSIKDDGQLTIAGSTAVTLSGIGSTGTGSAGSGGTGAVFYGNSSGSTATFANGASFAVLRPTSGANATFNIAGNGTVSAYGYGGADNVGFNVTLSGGTWNFGQVGQNNSGAQTGGTTNILNGATVNLAPTGANTWSGIAATSQGGAYMHGIYNVGGASAGTLAITGGFNETNGRGTAPTAGGINGLQVTVGNGGTFSTTTISALGFTVLQATGQTTAQTTNSVTVNSGGTATTAGTFTLANTSAAQTTSTTFNTLAVNGGTFSNSGGVLYIGNNSLANTQLETNTVTVAGGTLNQAGGAVSLGASGTAATNYANVLNVSSGAMNIGTAASSQFLQLGTAFNTAATVSNTVNLTGGKLVVSGTINALAGTGQVNTFNWTGGQLTAGTVTATTSTWAAAGGGGIASGILNNTGGTFAAGDIGTAGRTTITGGYTQGAGGTLAIDLGGTATATTFQGTAVQYDNLSVTGATTLGGRLNFNLTNSYIPLAATNHNIIVGTTAGATGAFTNQVVATSGNSRVVGADGLTSFLIATNTGTSSATVGGLTSLAARTTALGGYQATNTYTGTGTAWDTANSGAWSNFDPGATATPATQASGAIAQFADGTASTGAIGVSLNSSRNIQGIQFSSAAGSRAYTISQGGSGAIILDNTGNSASATIADTSTSGTANAINVPITLASNLAVSVTNAANNLTIGGAIGGSGKTLTKTGAGTLILSGANGYSGGTTIGNASNEGIVQITHAAGFGTGTVAVRPGASSGVAQLNLAVPGSGVGSSAADPNIITNAFNLGGQATSLSGGGFGAIQNVSGFNKITGNITRSNSGGNNYNIVAAANTLELSGTLSSTITTTRAFNFGGAGNIVVSGVINNGSGTTQVVKDGAGTLTLSNTNLYTGTTAVNAGTLLIGTSGSLANTAVTVGGAGATGTPTLGGGGTIGGATIIAAAGGGAVGTHSPGVTGVNNGVGTQTFSSTLDYGSGSIFEWNLQAIDTANIGVAADAATGTYDQVVANGAANSVTGGSAVFKIVLGGNAFTDAFWNTDKTWSNIFSGVGAPTNLASIFTSFSGTNVNTDGTVTGNSGYFTFNGSTTLNWTAVPEPTSALAGLLITAGLLRRRRVA